MDNVFEHEKKLTKYALEKMSHIEKVNIFGSPKNRTGVISFNVDGIHAQDLAQFLNEDNIAIRVGHHCAQPLLSRLVLRVRVVHSGGQLLLQCYLHLRIELNLEHEYRLH